jgi:2-[(L-alanin-3-ylcarbamoyl)methyl]-2-hydroxybutanedioate decarboxylase
MLPDPVTDALSKAARPVCAYVYDRAALRAQAEAVRAALPAGAELFYAVKANGLPAVVSTMASCADGLDVASGGELAAAVAAGAQAIAFAGPAKTDAELRAAASAGATIHVESEHELRRLSLVDTRVPVALRVNRAVSLPGSHQMTGTPTPFGIDEAALPSAIALASSLGLDVIGFHLHAVSNNLDAAAHASFVADSLQWARQYPIDLRYVNVGGGFGVDYTGGSRFDLDAFRAGVPAPPPGVRLVFEPGRLLAADAGWYAAQVLDLKRTHGRWFAVLRGGTHHFRLPAAWRYSHPFTVLPVDDWPYPFPRPSIEDAEVDAVGELCTPRDVLARGQRVDRLRVGDVLVFGRTGAYGWDISHHDFLRHAYPEMIIV